ncbi:MAG: peptidoglycan recognition protein family protein [Luteolibacter sp.]
MKSRLSSIAILSACLVQLSCAENSETSTAPSAPEAAAVSPAFPLTIMPRSAWDKPEKTPIGLKPHKNGKITNIVIHHTGPPNPLNEPAEKAPGRIASIYDHHTKNNGWKDLAYHYFIATDGTIYQGRSEKFQPDSGPTYPLDGTLAIVVLGDYSNTLPSQATLNWLVKLVRDRLAAHALQGAPITTHKSAGGNTTCPGPKIQAWFDTIGKNQMSQ